MINTLTKIKDVSIRYNITTRTLRFYEKMNLIKSSREESSGYRLYDETALSRLRQILILRKMNISIEDIGRIFTAKNSDSVLSVLDKKAADIDNEIAMLHELKEVVLAFIQQIRQVDFYNEADIKKLFDKASEIETALVKDNIFVESLFDTSDELDETVTSLMIQPKEGSKKVDKSKISLVNYEVIKMEARRFIGKTVYARAIFDYDIYDEDEAHTGTIFGNLWQKQDWIFAKLDAISQNAIPDDTHNIGLTTWEKYDHNQMSGYSVGRFMAAETPVPKGLDYFDFPEMYIAKGVAKGEVNIVEKRATGEFFVEINRAEILVRNEMELESKYNYNAAFVAEVYTQIPDSAGNITAWEVWVSCNANERQPTKYDLRPYIGKLITVRFSAEVKRTKTEGDLVWQINDGDKYPTIGEPVWKAENNVWHKMNGEWTGLLANDNPFLYVQTWGDNTDNAEYEIRDFSMDVITMDEEA